MGDEVEEQGRDDDWTSACTLIEAKNFGALAESTGRLLNASQNFIKQMARFVEASRVGGSHYR